MEGFNSLKRRQSVITEVFAEIGDTLVAKERCTIVVPFRYIQAGLLELSDRIYCATIYPVLNTKGEYGISNYCTKMEITCNDIEIAKVDGADYYFFRFEKGDVVCPDMNLVRDDTFSYLIYDEFVQKANAPWFMNYRDIGKVMSTAKEYAGVTLSDTNAIFELIVANLSRSRVDINKYYSQVIPDLKDSTLEKHPLQSIAINSVAYATTNNMNKLMGGYIEDGLTSALTSDSTTRSGVEEILRKQ